MKRLVFLIPAVVLTLLMFSALCPSTGAFVSTGDGGWYWQNQLPQGNGGNGVCFADAKHCWAAGYWGTILATSDGGATWAAQDSGTRSTLVGISFADASRGWAVGYDATILKTTNGGATWAPQQYDGPPGEYRLFSVSVVDARHVWIAGGYYEPDEEWWYGLILKTSDGGATWKAQTQTTFDAGLLGVSFPDAKHGWAVGSNGTICTTSDGGAHWRHTSSMTPLCCALPAALVAYYSRPSLEMRSSRDTTMAQMPASLTGRGRPASLVTTKFSPPG